MKRYQVRSVMALTLGPSISLPDVVKDILMHHVCTTPLAAEIIAALNAVGVDACREADICSPDAVAIWITVETQTVLLLCQLETLEVH